MNTDKAAEILSTRKKTFIDLGFFKDGVKKTIYSKLETDKNWKKALDFVLDTYGVKEVVMDVYAPNGSSYKLLETITIENHNMYGRNNNLPVPLLGLGNAETPEKGLQEQYILYMLSDKDEKINEKNDTIRELKDQHKIDQATIKELQDKNLQLEKENQFKDKEFEIQRKDELATERENRRGALDGIVESIQPIVSNPEFMEMAKMGMGALLAKWGAPPVPLHSSSSLGDVYDPNHSQERNDYMKSIVGWLKMQNQEMFAKFAAIVEVLSKNPNKIHDLINYINGGKSSNGEY